MITIEQIEDRFGGPCWKWAGKCHAVALAAASLIDGAVAVYGHYVGDVSPDSVFYDHSVPGFVRHGWVLLPDGTVLDPTRWVFEARVPYLYVGPATDYDEGGNRLRTAMLGEPPSFDPDDGVVNIGPDMLEAGAFALVEQILRLELLFDDEQYTPGDVTRSQLQWLAHVDPDRMQGHADAIYGMLDSLQLGALVPIDNRAKARRTE